MSEIVPPDIFGCFDAPDELTHLELARRHVVDTCFSVKESQSLAIDGLHNRVLFHDVVSDIDIPAADNSAMDGYAVAATGLPDEGVHAYRSVGEAYAGHPFDRNVNAGECVRIMTGAFMPAGTDTVIAQEHVSLNEAGLVVVGAGHRRSQNVRASGEDVRAGNVILARGKRIGSAEIGVLASLGKSHADVYRQPRVGVFSTGDELLEPGSTAAHGKIYDCNRSLLKSLLTSSGCTVVDLGILKDDAETVKRALTEAASDTDVIITSGGISTGAADHVGDSVKALGELGVWRIALRPGRPFAYGRIGTSRIFGLPGNPVAVMVTYYMLVVPALRRIAGDLSRWAPFHYKVRCTSSIRKKPNRTELYRAILSHSDSGELQVESTGNQGSGILTSMSRANCFIVLGHDDEGAASGDTVPVLPFSALN